MIQIQFYAASTRMHPSFGLKGFRGQDLRVTRLHADFDFLDYEELDVL